MGCQSSKPQASKPQVISSSIDTMRTNEMYKAHKEQLQNDLEKITKIMLAFEQSNQPSNSIYIEIKNKIAYLNAEIKRMEKIDIIMNKIAEFEKNRPNYSELDKKH